jgi:hypothetical protein
MAKREMVEAHVEKLLERITGSDDLKRDDEGDWPFGLNRGVMYVGVRGDHDPHVQVWGVAAVEVPEGPDLYKSLNETNNVVKFSRALYRSGEVLIATELVGESLDLEELQVAIDRIASGADHFGPKIVEACGGRTLKQEQPTSTDDRETPPAVGQYL